MRKRTITVKQYTNETKLMSLVPRERRVVYELKRVMQVHEWKSLQSITSGVLGLSEAEAVTDDQIAVLIQKAAKELKLTNTPDSPKDIEVDLDAMEQGKEDAIELKNESKQPLQEALVLSAILAAPTLLTLLANVIEWVYRFFALSKEEKESFKKDKAAYKEALKTGKLPDGTEADEHTLHDMEEKLFKTNVGKLILKLSHALHNLYVGPIRAIIAGLKWMGGQEEGLSFRQAWKEAKKPAEIIFAIIMIGIAGYFGIHALHGIPAVIDAVKSIGGLTKLASVVIDALKGGDMTGTVLKAIVGHVHL